MKSRLEIIKPWLPFISLFIFLRLPSLFEPHWYGDEAIYLVLGQAIRKGLTLYTQIHDNKPPTLYYLAALSQTVFGFRLLLLLWMTPTLFYFYKLSRRFFDKSISKVCLLFFLILTNIPLIEGNIANAEIFMLLPTIYAFYVFDPKYIKTYIIAGLCLGFAFTIKMPSLIEAGTLFFFFFANWLTSFSSKKGARQIQQIITASLIYWSSFLLPTLIWGVYFWSKNAFNQFMFASVYQNFPYLSSWQTGTHSGPILQSGLIFRLILLFFVWLAGFLFFRNESIDQKQFLLLSWLSACIFSSLLSTRPYPHYLIQLTPPFVISLFLFFTSPRIHFNLLVICSLIYLAFSLKHLNFYYYQNMGYYKAFYLGLTRPKQFQSFFGHHVSQSSQIVHYLKSFSPQDHSVFVWGDAPFIYSQLNILPPDIYTVAYHVVDFNKYHQTFANLKAHLPQFIVYYPMFSRPFPQLDNLISRYYTLDYQVDDVNIYKLR